MTILRGILKSFDGPSYTANVQLTGSLNTWLDGVAVARNIAAAELTAGRNAAIVFFEPGNPKDAILFAVWT